jgi:hypothetical protein
LSENKEVIILADFQFRSEAPIEHRRFGTVTHPRGDFTRRHRETMARR